MDRDGLVLYAGTNAMTGASPRRTTCSSACGRASAIRRRSSSPGLEHLEVLEVLTTRAVAATMRARYADVRVQSATLANLAVYAG